MQTLRDAIRRSRGQKAEDAVPVLSPFSILQMMEELRNLFNTIQSAQTDLHESSKEITTAHKEIVQRVDAVLEAHAEVLAHGKELRASFDRVKQGEPGQDAVIDYERLSREVAKQITVPKVDHYAIAARAAELIKTVSPEELAAFGSKLKEEILDDNTAEEKEETVPTPQRKLTVSDIDGLEKMLRTIERSSRTKEGMIHGGGMKLAAGSGQTLVRNKDGTWTLSISSSGGVLLPTETPDGNRTVFTYPSATAKPSFINIDGAVQPEVSDSGTIYWTWNAGALQATLTVPPNDTARAIV